MLMWQALTTLLSRSHPPGADTLLPCFHCQALTPASRMVTTRFDGAERQVCCHGCAAVLATVQQNGWSEQYRAARHAP